MLQYEMVIFGERCALKCQGNLRIQQGWKEDLT